jgi:hypothetical protein
MNEDEQREITDAIEGLSIDLDTAKNLRDTQVDRSLQDDNTLQIFNQDGVKNPLEDDIDGNMQNILNVNGVAATELSSDIAKFNSLTVGGVAVTSGVQIKERGSVIGSNITTLNFTGDGVSSKLLDASASTVEATINIGPELVVTKRPHSDQVPTQLGIVEEDTPFYWRSSGTNHLVGNWGTTSLLPAIGTTISKGTTNSFNQRPLNEQADFTFNRDVTAYLGIHTHTEQQATYDVDLSQWTLVFEDTSSQERIFKNFSPASTERLYFKIFPAGTHVLDDSFSHYFFKPFP